MSEEMNQRGSEVGRFNMETTLEDVAEQSDQYQIKKELKERLFGESVRKQLFDQFRESMEDSDFPDEYIEAFFHDLGTRDDDDIRRALSLPYELQLRFFSKHLEDIQSEKTHINDLVDLLVQYAENGGYDIGYHVSNKDISPQTHDDGSVTWAILGTEKDHRDRDLLRAYYSLDYEHLYRKKGGKFLYLVRAETGIASSHKQDNDGSWGRSSQLSVISVLDLREVDTHIEHIISDMDQYKENAT